MKFGLSVSMIVCFLFVLLIFTSEAEFDPETLVGVWLFDEGNGKVAEDSSGNGLDGALKGNAKWVDGQFGKGLEFDGATGYVEVPGHANPQEEITVSIWVKSNTPTWNQHGWFVEKRNAFVLHPNQGSKNVAWAICNGGCWNKPGGWNDKSTGPADITQWHMYTTTFDSATGEWFIYIDAEVASEMVINKTPLDADAGPVFIGNDTCCAGRFGNAIVDEVAIFNVALEEADIKSLMKNGLEGSVLDVDVEGKMTTTWGNVKTRY